MNENARSLNFLPSKSGNHVFKSRPNEELWGQFYQQITIAFASVDLNSFLQILNKAYSINIVHILSSK